MISLHLPIPPSTNRLWRHGRGRTYKSADYEQWIACADGIVMQSKTLRGWKTISGKFIAEIVLDERMMGKHLDPDNIIKPLIDAAQRWRIIANDKNLRRLVLDVGSAPEGCTLTIKEAA